MNTPKLSPQYQTILDAWAANERPGLGACKHCEHQLVTKVDGKDVIACNSRDVTTRGTVTPIGQARSTSGPCGPEAVFWLHPSDAQKGKSKPLELEKVSPIESPRFSGSILTAVERASVWANASKRGQS